jgi:PrcB C-terminal
MRRALLLLGVLAACGGDAPPDSDQPPPGEFLQSLYFRTAHEVVRDAQTWDLTWPKLSGDRSVAPRIDFNNSMVLVAALGERPTSGYFVSIEDVRVVAGPSLAAVVKEFVPGPGCGKLQVTTTPAIAVVVPKIAGDVVFSTGAHTRTCK